MAYTPRLDWIDDPDQGPAAPGKTPVGAVDVLRWEVGIDDAHKAIAELPAPLALGTTAGTALAGNTSLLKVGPLATDAKAGNYTPPAASSATSGLVKQGAAVADAVDDTDVVAQVNALLASLRTAGVIAT